MPWAADQTLGGHLRVFGRLEVRAATENHRSRRVPERLGFVKEGVLRDAERINDRYIDHIVYSVLAEDWDD